MTLFDIAVQYHVRCELFDRSICSGISERTGNAMPVDAWERKQVNENAAYELAAAGALAAAEISAPHELVMSYIKSDAVHYESERILRQLSRYYGKGGLERRIEQYLPTLRPLPKPKRKYTRKPVDTTKPRNKTK